jgi:hypothetical protein
MSRAPTSLAREQAERHQFLDTPPPPSYPPARTVFREAEPEPVEVEEAVGATEPQRQGGVGTDLAPASPILDDPPAASPPPALVESKPELEPNPNGWHDEPAPANIIVLVTDDPTNPDGVRGRWYRRRQFTGGRWVVTESWVHAISTSPIWPQPRFWKPDPERVQLRVLAS